MARIRKEYKMTEKNLEYIEEVKEKNNLKYFLPPYVLTYSLRYSPLRYLILQLVIKKI